MKKYIFGLIILSIGTTLFLINTSNKEKNNFIPIIYPVTVDSLIKIGQGIKSKNINIEELSAEGVATRFSTVVDTAIAKETNVIFTVGTQITNTILGQKYSNKRPFIIATAISDPNKINIKDDINISIISDISNNPKISTNYLLSHMTKELKLKFTHVGIIANKGEENSIGTAKIAENTYFKMGSKITYGYLSSTSDIIPITKSLINKGVDLIIIPHDKIAVGNASSIVNIATKSLIPVISLDDGTVEKHGVLFGISTDYKKIGLLAAQELLKFNKGQIKQGVNIIYPNNIEVILNLNTAKKLNLKINSKNKNQDFNIRYIK